MAQDKEVVHAARWRALQGTMPSSWRGRSGRQGGPRLTRRGDANRPPRVLPGSDGCASAWRTTRRARHGTAVAQHPPTDGCVAPSTEQPQRVVEHDGALTDYPRPLQSLLPNGDGIGVRRLIGIPHRGDKPRRALEKRRRRWTSGMNSSNPTFLRNSHAIAIPTMPSLLLPLLRDAIDLMNSTGLRE